MNRTLCTTLTTLGLAVLLWSVAQAADTAEAGPSLPQGPYQTMGAPSDPKVPAQWNRYHDSRDIEALLRELAAAYPEYAQLSSLGQSYGGREMWLLTVTDPATGAADSKPGFWIDGCIHANEIQGTEVVLYTAWYLLEARASTPFIAQLLKERSFYLFPVLSPDARDAHFYEANDASSPRTGLRPVDEDQDGLIDEDGPDDLDGDGHLTNMRVRDPNGRWKADAEYPDRLVPCDPDEKGEFTNLRDEGIDNDGDGQVNEDGPGGYDPNRNWAWDWEPTYVQYGASEYPFSIYENRVVADFVLAHPNIAGAQSYHNAAGMILHGPGNPGRPINGQDDRLYNLIGEKGAGMLPGYKNAVVYKDLYNVWGGEFDWFYGMNGVLAYTNELFTSYNYFHTTSDEGWQGSREDQRKFDKYLLFGSGYVPWHEYDHPIYGKIEIGGTKKSWGRQPPSFMLEEECHRNMAFTLYHCDQLPLVAVQSTALKELGNGLYELNAVFINQRMVPTHLGVDLEHSITRPDWAELTLSSGKVVAAYWSDEQFFRRQTEQKEQPQRVEIPNIGGMDAVYVRWIVAGQPAGTVSLDSVKGGRAMAPIAP